MNASETAVFTSSFCNQLKMKRVADAVTKSLELSPGELRSMMEDKSNTKGNKKLPQNITKQRGG